MEVKNTNVLQLDDMTVLQKNMALNLWRQVDKDFTFINEKSPETRKRYHAHVKSFASYMAAVHHKETLKRVQNKHIQGYVAFLYRSGCSRSYVKSKVSALRFYFRKRKQHQFTIYDDDRLGV